MKTKITKTALAKAIKDLVKENREWFFDVNRMGLSDETLHLFFAREADRLLDHLNTIANKILKDLK